eukprot:jgi/Botrbrau1/6337/Bobra.0339s0044.1
MSILGSGSVHLTKRFRRAAVRKSGGADAICQKCLQKGHWTFECTNDRVYNARPTRTEQLFDPKKRPRFMAPSELLPGDQAPAQIEPDKKKAKKTKIKESPSSSSSSSSDSEDDSSTSSSSGSSSSSSDDTSSSSGSDTSSSDDSSTSSGSSSSSDDSSSSSSSGSSSDDSSSSSSSSSDSDAPPRTKKPGRVKSTAVRPPAGESRKPHSRGGRADHALGVAQAHPNGASFSHGHSRPDGERRPAAAVKVRSVVVRPNEAAGTERGQAAKNAVKHREPIIFDPRAVAAGPEPPGSRLRGSGRGPRRDQERGAEAEDRSAVEADRYQSAGGRAGDRGRENTEGRDDREERYSRRKEEGDRSRRGYENSREVEERAPRGRGDPDRSRGPNESRYERGDRRRRGEPDVHRGRDERGSGHERRERPSDELVRGDERARGARQEGERRRQRAEEGSPGAPERSRSPGRHDARGERVDRGVGKRRADAPDPAKVVIRQRHAHHGLGTDELVPGAAEAERSPSSASPLPSDSDLSAM